MRPYFGFTDFTFERFPAAHGVSTKSYVSYLSNQIPIYLYENTGKMTRASIKIIYKT